MSLFPPRRTREYAGRGNGAPLIDGFLTPARYDRKDASLLEGPDEQGPSRTADADRDFHTWYNRVSGASPSLGLRHCLGSGVLQARPGAGFDSERGGPQGP